MRDVDLRHAACHAPAKHAANEGIYPTPRMTKDELDQFRSLVLKPVLKVDSRDRDGVEDLMITLVAASGFRGIAEYCACSGSFSSQGRQ